MRRLKHGSLLVRSILVSDLFPLLGPKQANHFFELESMYFMPLQSLHCSCMVRSKKAFNFAKRHKERCWPGSIRPAMACSKSISGRCSGSWEWISQTDASLSTASEEDGSEAFSTCFCRQKKLFVWRKAAETSHIRSCLCCSQIYC